MLPNEDKNKEIIKEEKEENKLLGRKKEREKEPNYIPKEEAFSIYEYKSKNLPKDIQLIKSYSKFLYHRLSQSPIEIINIIVSPFMKFDDYFLELYSHLLLKIKEINTPKKIIIKYMYNNGIMHNEPIELPCDYNDITEEKNDCDKKLEKEEENRISNSMVEDKEDNKEKLNTNEKANATNPHFVVLNTREICESIKDYKWEGIIKIIIIFGENGFCKQIIKNIDIYHNNYLIINLNTITQRQKQHFNNIINDIYTFDDIISSLKQDIYNFSKNKNNTNNIYIKDISDNFNDYNDILKRYSNYNIESDPITTNDKINYICFNLFKKNVIDINKKQIALYDANSCSKTFLSICYTSKINYIGDSSNNLGDVPNIINPKLIINHIGVELSVSNNIYNILDHDYNEETLNIHINNLTLGKKMIGYTNIKLNKDLFNHENIINTTLLNYAICDYICNIFNLRLHSQNISLNTIEIHFYEFTNYSIPYLIAKEFLTDYTSKYQQELLDSFSHFSYCISYGKILIDNIIEYNGKIFSFSIYKDKCNEINDINNEEYINIFKFFCYHKCNKFCELLGLNNVGKKFYEINNSELYVCCICKNVFKISEDVREYDYRRDGLCLCFECYKKIYESKYFRVCSICGEKFEYFYNFYILQKIETPSLCKECEKIKNNDLSENENKSKEENDVNDLL